ncbi:PLP-dependent cysteine synthase family protein [Pedobacter gandavensis]|uniref:PLP-dependent cysteine synthase family protein n=1 Tax=Pedobacter gandavensis TaxID=2679963 RepID=UPI00292FB565|nr:PLP-dependent cysteine synthase family protein [Pedobacter gandavensis]
MMWNQAKATGYMHADLVRRVEQLWQLVGNTPMLELHYHYKGTAGFIFVKCENYNLSGSIKDRTALNIIHEAYKNCTIKPGDTIIEASNGNSGIAFAAIGRALGHPVKILMPDSLSREKTELIRNLGAELILVSKEQGGFLGCIKKSEQFASKKHVFLPKQFENPNNTQVHEKTTGPEISKQLKARGLKPDAFVAGVGTGGTIMGVGKLLKSIYPDISIHPLEPFEHPMLRGGCSTGQHRIQGISEGFIPKLLNLSELGEVVQVNDGDAIIMAQKLANELGLAVGISSGANIVAAIKLKQAMRPDAIVVTLMCDDNKKYLSTDLLRLEPIKDYYVSSGLYFTGCKSISRFQE